MIGGELGGGGGGGGCAPSGLCVLWLKAASVGAGGAAAPEHLPTVLHNQAGVCAGWFLQGRRGSSLCWRSPELRESPDQRRSLRFIPGPGRGPWSGSACCCSSASSRLLFRRVFQPCMFGNKRRETRQTSSRMTWRGVESDGGGEEGGAPHTFARRNH